MVSVRTVKAVVLDAKSDTLKVLKILNSSPSNKTGLHEQLDSAIKNLTSAKSLIGETTEKKEVAKTSKAELVTKYPDSLTVERVVSNGDFSF